MIKAVVPDKATGDVFTEAMWDTFIKDNLNQLSVASTTFPSSPIDGQVHFYPADTNGTMWMFRYRAGSASAYKWEFVGGAPLRADTANDAFMTASTTFVVPTNTTNITVPLAGDYRLESYLRATNNTANANTLMAWRIAGVDGYAECVILSNTNAIYFTASAEQRVNGLAASTLIEGRVRVGSGTGQYGARQLVVTPIRVQG